MTEDTLIKKFAKYSAQKSKEYNAYDKKFILGDGFSLSAIGENEFSKEDADKITKFMKSLKTAFTPDLTKGDETDSQTREFSNIVSLNVLLKTLISARENIQSAIDAIVVELSKDCGNSNVHGGNEHG